MEIVLKYKLTKDIVPYVENNNAGGSREYTYDINGRIIGVGIYSIQYCEDVLIYEQNCTRPIFNVKMNSIYKIDESHKFIFCPTINTLQYSNTKFDITHTIQGGKSLVKHISVHTRFGSQGSRIKHFQYRYKNINKLDYTLTNKNKILMFL